MKTTHLFLILIIFLSACSSPKTTTSVKKDSPGKSTEADVFRGGTSFENPVVIKVEKESAGIEEEYKWLSNNYPGYSAIKKSHISAGKKHYDVIRIRTRDRQVKDIYFDVTSFFGKY